MFAACEFSFAGRSSGSFGLYLADIGSSQHQDNPFGNIANIVEERIGGRVRPLHYGVRYHDSPLTFTLIFCGDKPIDRRKMQEVAGWLTGYQQYQWLTIHQPDLENLQYRCLVRKLTPVSVGWYPVGFEAEFVCDCPYAYGPVIEKAYEVDGSLSEIFVNEGSAKVRFEPLMKLKTVSGCTNFSVVNETTGETTTFSALPAGGAEVTLDCENKIVTEQSTGLDLYNGHFNFVFPAFEPGENILTFEGKGSVEIGGRFLYNPGA